MFNRSFDQIVAPLQKIAEDLKDLQAKNGNKVEANALAIDRLMQANAELEVESMKASAVKQKIEALLG